MSQTPVVLQAIRRRSAAARRGGGGGKRAIRFT